MRDRNVEKKKNHHDKNIMDNISHYYSGSESVSESGNESDDEGASIEKQFVDESTVESQQEEVLRNLHTDNNTLLRNLSTPLKLPEFPVPPPGQRMIVPNELEFLNKEFYKEIMEKPQGKHVLKDLNDGNDREGEKSDIIWGYEISAKGYIEDILRTTTEAKLKGEGGVE